MRYTRLTEGERWQIGALHASGKSYAEIGRQLGRHERTIKREIDRNSTVHGYKPDQAQRMAENRHNQKNWQRRKLVGDILDLVIEKLKEYWSPEQISGWLKVNYGLHISAEIIYQYIWKAKRRGVNLYKYLRHGGKKYHKRSKVNGSRSRIPNRVDISHRPAIVDTKQRLGDWEADTIVGKNRKGFIVSLVDRKSKYTKLAVVPNKTSAVVIDAIHHCLDPHKHKTNTITFDNGTEFTNHQDLQTSLEAKTYFATPYHSWERGLNEHTNGLVRQFLPKKTDFTSLSQQHLAHIESLLNNRPRKSLNYKSPHQVFYLSPPLPQALRP